MRKKPILSGNQNGVSLIELLIVMALVVIVLTMNTSTFGVIFRESRGQTQVVGAQMDRIVGLEILRTDLEHAGFGLPWSYPSALVNYDEAAGTFQSAYNDTATSAPRAIVSGNNPSTFTLNNSDYLVIKSTVVGTSETSQRWTYIVGGLPHPWGSNDLGTSPATPNTERVITILPRTGGGASRQLVVDSVSSNFFTIYPPTGNFAAEGAIIYGVDPDTDLRMPFNRADYYVRGPAPQGCAPNTGRLYKATINQAGGALNPESLLDCVADMQVVYRLDTNSDGLADSVVSDLSAAGLTTAQQIREQVKEVRVYILSHEGQSDKAFTYGSNTIYVGDPDLGGGRTFAFSAIGTGWEHYRWKLSSLVAKPRNLSN